MSVFMIFSCNNDNINSNYENTDLTIPNPDLYSIFFGNDEKIGAPVQNTLIEVESDLVSLESGNCYTVNVRIYLTYDGNRFLVANDDAVICGDNKNMESNSVGKNNNSNCNGYLPNGDYVYENQVKMEYCLLQILLANDEVYSLYKKEIQKYKK